MNPTSARSHYDLSYGNFHADLYAEIRREAFGEDIGQNSWLTRVEHDRFLGWLNLASSKSALDVCCGAGGPALRMAATTGCSIVGIDTHEQAIAAALALAAERGLAGRSQFQVMDAARPLAFPDACFDAIICIDAIVHLPGRLRVLGDWARLLKPRGRLLFTDSITVTGPVTNAEIQVRSSAGSYLFVPLGYDQTLLQDCGLRVIACENLTSAMAEIAARRHAARASRSSDLRAVEGDSRFELEQEFLAVTAATAAQGCLSRFVYVAEKPD